jgi:hypothetical protein
MRIKNSEIKLLLSLVLFIAALGCMFYNIFYNSATNTKTFYVILSLVLGRFSVILLRKARLRAK